MQNEVYKASYVSMINKKCYFEVEFNLEAFEIPILGKGSISSLEVDSIFEVIVINYEME